MNFLQIKTPTLSKSLRALLSKYADAGAKRYLSLKVSNNPFSVILELIPSSSPNSVNSLISVSISLKESSSYLGLIYSSIKDGMKELACCWSNKESLPSRIACCPSNNCPWLKAFFKESSSFAKSVASTCANAYSTTNVAKSNVIKVLKELKDNGASLNILTASPHVTLDACLKRLKIFDLFDNVWSCEDFSTTKTNPEIYKLVSKKLNVNVKDVLFLDDNLNANLTAKSAGMKVCGVFDESSVDYIEQMKSICDFYIYDFDQLLKIK